MTTEQGIKVDKVVIEKEKSLLLGKLYRIRPRLNDEQYRKLLYRTEISLYEIGLIYAYQTDLCIQRLKEDQPKWVWRKIESENRWLKSWESVLHTADKSVKHLTEVCAYHAERYKSEYELSWLLDWDEEMYSRVVNRYVGSRKAGRKVRELLEGLD